MSLYLYLLPSNTANQSAVRGVRV